MSPQGAQLRFTVHMRRSATGIGDGRSHIHPRVKNTEVGFAALGVHAAVIDRVKTITVLQWKMTARPPMATVSDASVFMK